MLWEKWNSSDEDIAQTLEVWENFVEKATSNLKPQECVGISHIKEPAALNTKTSSTLIQLHWLFLFLIATAQIYAYAAHLGCVGTFKCKCVLQNVFLYNSAKVLCGFGGGVSFVDRNLIFCCQ